MPERVYIGDDFIVPYNMVNPDQSAMDLTGATVSARVVFAGATVVSATIENMDAGAGSFTARIPRAETATWATGGKYQFRLRIDDSAGVLLTHDAFEIEAVV